MTMIHLYHQQQPSPITLFPTKRPRRMRRVWRLIIGVTLLFLGWIGYHLLAQPDWLTRLPAWSLEWLALSEAAGGFTLTLLWSVIGWQQWRRRRPVLPALDREALYALTPADFERYVAHLFRQKGYQVKIRGGSGDHGVDLELRQPGGKRAIVQCKRYQRPISPDIVRELYGTLIHEGAAHAFLVTTAVISKASRQWAQGKPITLIDGPTLVNIATALQNHP